MHFPPLQLDAAEEKSRHAELTRGKTGRLYGNLMSVLTTMKALPSSYNRDLQEDKEALFDSVDTIGSALDVLTAMLPQLTISPDRMGAAANDPNLFATDLAEYLVKKERLSGKHTKSLGNLLRMLGRRKLRWIKFRSQK